MPEKTFIKRKLPLWQQLAAFLGFLALASALLAPSVMMADEVRTGKLGGLCLANGSVADVDAGSTLADNAHCDACSSLAFAMPSFTPASRPTKPNYIGASACQTFDLLALVAGLPPSRGPPVF